MAKQKIETSIEINGIDVVAYPLVESDHVTFENGMSINEMIKGDVVTPVVTHEETSFKVGKGDSDVSSSIVDSSVGEMIIKGQTYQNILPDPSLQNNMNNGKSMQKINEGYDSVNVVDGIAKSAILSGNTLVNVANQIHVINYVEQPKADYITLVHTGNENAKSIRLKNNGLLKPNTKYLIMLDVVENTLTTKMQISKNAALCGFNDIEMYPIKAGQTGVVKLIVTSKNEFINVRDYLYLTTLFGQIGDGTQQIKLRIMLLEYQDGMENWDIPYFEGMKSVQSPSLVSVGKNLIGLVEEWEKADVDNKTGVVIPKPNGTRLTSNLIRNPIKNRLYVRSIGAMWNFIYYYDINKNYLGHETNQGMTDNFQLPNSYTPTGNEYYVRVSFRDEDAKNKAELYTSDIGRASYEPHKSNTLTTPSDLTLRGIGDVCDTLDLVSGEKVERIGEVVFDGRENWRTGGWANQTDTIGFETQIGNARISRIFKGMSDKLSYTDNFNLDKECFTVVATVHGEILVGIRILRSKLSSEDVSGLEKYLQSNPIPIQYELETPIVKTVDLSSSGNWEKVVLDGSEDEGWGKTESTNSYTKSLWFMPSIEQLRGGGIFCDKLPTTINGNSVGVRNSNSGGIYIHISKDSPLTVREWVSQNAPITVWYQTTTHKDSTQVKQPLSFSNGHIQLSSEEGSLIPSLDYEVSTSNSYHLDLAKTSTQYTMKNMSGTFTIDNNNYNASANSAFTTPTSMANKLMITSVVQSNVMLLEGDLTSKTIPYFKGIKSAFEGEDEIEILSTGRNIFDSSTLGTPTDEGYFNRNEIRDRDITLKPNTTYTLSYESKNTNFTNPQVWTVRIYKKGGVIVFGEIVLSSETHSSLTFTTDNKGDLGNLVLSFVPNNGDYTGEYLIKNIQLKECAKQTPYEPYKSNITKIPLSSPLRSLPNGICDEVVIDRENNKVKVIQRIGEQVFDGSSDENWAINQYNPYKDGTHYQVRCWLGSNAIKDGLWLNKQCILSDRLPSTDWELHWNGIGNHGIGGDRENIMITWKRDNAPFSDVATLRAWLSKNPTTVYYELATPVITEIDLDGYPYIYKDGHIFLNSKIAPTTTMKYSINQSHQIESQNGDLIRHEKEINYLYTLIAKYVNVQYESTLLNLDLELSRA